MDVDAQAKLGCRRSKSLDHGRGNLGERSFRSQEIGIGKQVAFEAFRGRVKIGDERGFLGSNINEFLPRSKARLLEPIANFEDVRPFGMVTAIVKVSPRSRRS